MASFREIVTKAILGKGKKNFIHKNSVNANNKPSTVLGCWVINHVFNGEKNNNQIKINGSYDINIWYSFDNDTKTDVIKENIKYEEIVKMNNDKTEYDNGEIIVRSLKDPKCKSVNIDNNTINFEVEVELGIELVGETKVKISVDDKLDDYFLIEDLEETEKNMENIKEDYLEKK